MNAKLILLAGSLALTAVQGADPVNARTAFAQLQTLVGEWEGKTEAGRSLKVSYRLTANNTVLVETWTLGPQRESLKLYHMDNESLIATHYCPVGNQPRLRFKEGGSTSLFVFEFVSATNLPKPKWRTSIALKWNFSIPGPSLGARPIWRMAKVNRSASFTHESSAEFFVIRSRLRSLGEGGSSAIRPFANSVCTSSSLVCEKSS
jgi:hypothetical protein